jgi:hypothetical protein
MIEFNIENGRLTVDAKTLTIRAFEDIWKSDKSTNKPKAVSLLKYVFFMNDITTKNPYRDAAEAELERLAKRDAFKNEKYKLSEEEQALFDEASYFYLEANKDCVYRMSFVLTRKIDQMLTFLDNEKISNTNFKGQFETVKNISTILRAKAEAEAEVEKQVKNKRNRAGIKTSPGEKGLLKLGPRTA